MVKNDLDHSTIAAQLRKSELPSNVRELDVEQEIRQMAEKARALMILDKCGGLPGPGIIEDGTLRKILNFLERISRYTGVN